MKSFALLCGSAPENYRQKKLAAMYDFLTSKAGGAFCPQNIIVFPNGVSELMLESALNSVFDKAYEEEKSEVFLYFCADCKAHLSAELSDSELSGIKVVRLGKDEIRKDVIAYYSEKLSKRLGVKCRVAYEVDGDFVREEELGYESVSGGCALC